MSTLELIVYGNGEIYREFFNAIALSMGSSGYESLIKLTILIAGAWVLVESILKRNLMLNVKWLVTYMLVFYILFLPKTTLTITDRLDPGKPYAVDNVPLGLAIFASYTSRIGDGLTRLTEQYFTMPDYQPYAQTGMVMASRMVKAASEFQITDPKFNQNMQEFVGQCVFYDLLLEKYSIHDLVEAPNIWQLVSERASPARSFIFNREVTICKDGAKLLNQEWGAAIQDAEERFSRRISPQNSLAKQELLKRLPMSYAYLTKVTEQAATIMQQNMMANLIKERLIDNPGQSSIEGMSFAKAQMQKRLTNATIGDMAAHWLPIMKIVFECIMYGSFIFIFLLSMFPFGLTILKHYLYSLMWIQIWAPLYAIINLIISYYAHVRSMGAVTNGLTLTSMAGLQQINSDIAGMAGYISISVPFISTIIVKGMADGFTQLAQYIGGVTQSAALGAASEMATGNLSLGNTSFANNNAFNTSMNHSDTSARALSGSINYQLPTGSVVSVMPDGTAVLDNRSAISSLGTSINLGSALRAAGSKQFEIASSSAISAAKAMVDHYSSGMRELYDLGSSTSHSISDGKSSSVSEAGGFTDSAHQVSQLMTSFEKAHNLNKSQTTRLFGSIYADGHLGINKSFSDKGVGKIVSNAFGIDGSFGGSVGIRGEGSVSKENIDNNLVSEAKKYAEDNNFNQLVDHSLKAIKEDSYRSGSEQSHRLSDSIGSSFDKGTTLRDEMLTNYQKSEVYREAASISDEQVASINQNANQQFVNWLSNQHAPNTSGKIGMYQAENMRTQQPEIYQGYVEQYVREQTEERLSSFEKEHIRKGDVEQSFAKNAENLSGSRNIRSDYADYKKQVASEAHTKNVGKKVSIDSAEHASRMVENAHSQLESAQSEVKLHGKSLEGTVKEKIKK